MRTLDESCYHPVLLDTGGISLVLFTSASCGTCRAVERRLPRAAPPGCHLFQVDVQKATGLARAFDIFHLPSLLLYSDGRFHACLDCEVSAVALSAALVAALSAPAQEEP